MPNRVCDEICEFWFKFLFWLLKTLIHLAPVMVILTVGVAAPMCVFFLRDGCLVFFSIACTNKLGPIAKTLASILAVVGVVLWPVGLVVGSVLHSFWVTAIGVMKGDSFWNPGFGVYSVAREAVRDFWEWELNEMPNYWRVYRTQPCEDPWEVPVNCDCLSRLFLGLLLMVIGVVVDGVGVSAIVLLKLVPFIFRGWYVMVKLLCESDSCNLICMCFPVLILSFILWPAVVAIGAAFFCVGGVLIGMAVPVGLITYDEYFCSGLKEMFNILHKVDSQSNEFLFETKFSCFPSFDTAPTRRPMDPFNNPASLVENTAMDRNDLEAPEVAATAAELSDPTAAEGGNNKLLQGDVPPPDPSPLSRLSSMVSEATVWDHLFAALHATGEEALQSNLVPVDDIERYLSDAPTSDSVAVGLTAVVVARAIGRSVFQRSPGLLLHSGITVTDETRPTNFFAEAVWDRTMALKMLWVQLNVLPEEMPYLETSCLYPLQEDKLQGLTVLPTEERRKGLMPLVVQLRTLATTTSRVPTFRRRARESLQNAMGRAH